MREVPNFTKGPIAQVKQSLVVIPFASGECTGESHLVFKLSTTINLNLEPGVWPFFTKKSSVINTLHSGGLSYTH